MPLIILEIQPKSAKNSVCCESIVVPVPALAANHALVMFVSLSFSAQRLLQSIRPLILLPRLIHLRLSISSCSSLAAAFKLVQIGLSTHSMCCQRCARFHKISALTHSKILNNGSLSAFNSHYSTIANGLLEAFTVLLFGA